MKTFIDTSPFIYLIENNPQFAAKTRKFIMDAVINNEELITSVITIMEFGVIPQKKGRQDLILKFEDFLKIMNISIEEIDQEMARKAFQLRAKYDFLKSMDALQISVALEKNCDQFLTNDRKLKKVSELQIVIIEEL